MKQGYEGRIAIIGMAGRMPNSASLDEFWQALVAGKSLLTPLDETALIAAGVPEAIRNQPNYVAVASSMADIDCFDHEFFGYGRREASIIDPQQRVLLELAHEVFEHAGYIPEQLDIKVGVYVGTGYCNYLVNNLSGEIDANDQLSGLQILMGNDKEYAATRVSYKLNLKGPSVAVNSACSTSLVALHQACRALQAFDCDLAIAGAAKISIPNLTGYLAQDGGISSKDGTCRPYDVEGTGPIFGSGAGVVLLKRMEDAIADGDQIYAVIRGSAINNDGAAKVSFSAPSTDGQIDVIADALADANLSATEVGYVEGHGTSTPLGDPIEIAALSELYQAEGVAPGSCYLGSVKANVGHLEAAAGMAGLFKTVYALRHDSIPPQFNFNRPNKNIALEQTPFIINREPVIWPRKHGQEPVAGISSFGIGGTNAHVILQAYAPDEKDTNIFSPSISGPYLIPLSAMTQQQLTQLQSAYQQLAQTAAPLSLAQVALHAAVGRKHYGQRVGFIAKDQQEFAQQLAANNSDAPTATTDSLLLLAGEWDLTTWELDNSMLAISLRAYLKDVDNAILGERKGNLALTTRVLIAYGCWLKASGVPIKQIYTDRDTLAIAAYVAGAITLGDAICALLIHQGQFASDAQPEKKVALTAIRISEIKGNQLIPYQTLSMPECWRAEQTKETRTLSLQADIQIGQPTGVEATKRINLKLLQLLSHHYEAGITIHWSAVYRGIQLQKLALPTYPFAKVRCWIDSQQDNNTDRLASVKTSMTTAITHSAVIAHIATFGHKDVSGIALNTQFQRDLMMESMMLAEFNASLKKQFGLKENIPLAFYFEGGTVGGLLTRLQQATVNNQPENISANANILQIAEQIDLWQLSSTFPLLQRVERRQVHKTHDKNVLVARIGLIDTNLFIAEITQDAQHEYYYEHAQDHVPGLYIIEAARQAATAIVHQYYQVPFGYKFILNDLNSSFSHFAELNAPLLMSMNFSDLTFKNGIVDRARATVDFYQHGKVIGTMQSQAVIFAPNNYDVLRDGQAVIAE
jgi:3-oxoacyl-(acyl-carrier-protein) synthase